jgi:hypothetical protein
MRWFIILSALYLLTFTSCKEDEPEFNPNIHIAKADASFVDMFNTTAIVSLIRPNDQFDPEEHYSFSFPYEVGDGISTMFFRIRISPDLRLECVELEYRTREDWFDNGDKPIVDAQGGEADLVTDLFYLSQDSSVVNDFCITSISANGREVSGTFNLHFVKDPDSRVDPSVWPDTMSLTNGTFVAFLHQ